MRRSKGWLAAGAAVSALLSVGGCLGGGEAKWKEPAIGEAEVLLNTAGGDAGKTRDASLGFSGSPNGLTVGPDGKVYSLGTSLAVIEGDHKVGTILDGEAHGAGGLVVLSSNSFVVGKGAQVLRMRADGTRTVLAGTLGKSRKLGEPVSGTVSAKTYHLSNYLPEPFGVRPDGSVLFVDGDVIWRLKAGNLKRVYQVPTRKDGADKTETPVIDVGSAVDQSGTVYARSSTEVVPANLGDVMTISQDGSVGKLDLPKRVAGVKGDLAALEVGWMAGDGGNGVYVRASSHSADYVLHVASGNAELIARDLYGDSDSGCKEGYLVDVMKLPCQMPWALTYSRGSLFMAGNSPVVLKIATK
ncbi:hypothetical protein OG204_21930 [Streptomyces sp. NBC_01387]|uniref:hypothetical protein n=1 Tax=Streptomyces sp. NBC_01387 TaxID=2903849 RepID=UPI003247A925